MTSATRRSDWAVLSRQRWGPARKVEPPDINAGPMDLVKLALAFASAKRDPYAAEERAAIKLENVSMCPDMI